MTSVLNVDTIAAKDGTSPVELTKQQCGEGMFVLNGQALLHQSKF